MDVEAVQVVVLGLIVYRAARLVAWDEISLRPREAWRAFWRRRGPAGRLLSNLIECPMCLSVWFSAAAVAATDAAMSVPSPGWVFGAVAGLSGLFAALDANAATR